MRNVSTTETPPSDPADEGWLPVEGATEPADKMEIHDIDVMLEATHPIRGLVLRRLKHPHTVAEVAAAMQVPVTRLYHHVNRLVDAGLIRVVATRQVAAVTERRYQVTARSFGLHRDVFESSDRKELALAMGSIFDLAKIGLQRLIESGGYDEVDPGDESGHSAISLGEIHLTDERRRELMQRLESLFQEFTPAGSEEGPDTTPITLFVAAFPEPPDTHPEN